MVCSAWKACTRRCAACVCSLCAFVCVCVCPPSLLTCVHFCSKLLSKDDTKHSPMLHESESLATDRSKPLLRSRSKPPTASIFSSRPEKFWRRKETRRSFQVALRKERWQCRGNRNASSKMQKAPTKPPGGSSTLERPNISGLTPSQRRR